MPDENTQIQCAAKKVSPKVLCHFLSNRSEFLRNFTRLLLIHNHKIAKQHCFTFICDKVIKFLGWPRNHFWCSQNVCRTKDASYCVMWHKVHRDLNNKINNSLIVYRQLSCTHLTAEWSFTYQSCDRSLWLVIPDHLQCLLAHGGSVNNKCFTKSIKKLSMNKSDETYCLHKFASLWHHQLNNISHLFILV